MEEIFTEHFLSQRFGGVNWTARSPELTSCKFVSFNVAELKDFPPTLTVLKAAI